MKAASMNAHPSLVVGEPIETPDAPAAAEVDAMVRFAGISKTYPAYRGKPGVNALEGIDFAIARGSITGVIGRKPIHLMKDDDRKQAPKIKDLHIDIGARDDDEAKGLVRIGDVAVIDVAPVELRNGRVISRALDNRVGCYVAAEAARLVAESGGAPGDVVALAVVQEETTFAGARTSAFAHEPDVAIVVDLTFETDQPGVELGEMTKHTFGSGAVIARGTTLHPTVFERLHDAAQEQGIPFTVESLGRGTGTDADAIHLSRAGVPTGLISVPSRYMHSPVEMVSLEDIDAAARLIASFAAGLTADTSFQR